MTQEFIGSDIVWYKILFGGLEVLMGGPDVQIINVVKKPQFIEENKICPMHLGHYRDRKYSFKGKF